MMTIIVLVALTAMAMEEMSEVSSTSFAMEEESTRMARMILNNKDNNKSSTKFFMEENNKDEGVSCLDGLYNVPRKEENVLGKKNKENSEVKIKVKGGSLVGNFRTRKEDSLSFKYVGGCAQHISFHFLYPMASGGSNPFFGEEVMAITSGEDARTQLSPQNLNHSENPLPSFSQRGGYFLPLVGGWRQWENKERREENDFTQKQSF